jgi:DNA-binding GntR family transcriptional regulator
MWHRSVFQLRMLLEAAAARLAAQNPNAAHSLDQAEKIIGRMDVLVRPELTPEKLLEASELDSSFHGCIAQASGNKRLVKCINELNSVQQFGYAKYPNRPLAETGREHHSILKAIKSGDGREGRAGDAPSYPASSGKSQGIVSGREFAGQPLVRKKPKFETKLRQCIFLFAFGA